MSNKSPRFNPNEAFFVLDVSADSAKVDLNCLILEHGEKTMSLEGKKAPDFNLEGSDGRQHSLQDYRGKTVVIYFYPKDNTSGCTKEACGFRDNFSELASKGAVVIGVSKDSIASHGKFITNYRLPFVLLSDPDTSMMQVYGAFGEKVMYGKKTMGTIRSTVIIGPDGTVMKQWTKVAKAEQHPEQVLEYLRG
jgi:peroxiredoxin Q/BCP